MPLPHDFLHVVSISNNLQGLVPVGVLAVHGLPIDKCAFQAVPTVGSKTWKWLDAHYLHAEYAAQLSGPLRALIYLIRLRYIAATFRVYRLKQGRGAVFKVRIYAIPLDIAGSRHLRSWRAGLLNQQLARKFLAEWTFLLEFIDFSPESWLRLGVSCIVPFFGHGAKSQYPTGLAGMERWLLRLKCSKASASAPDSLDSVVQRIYASISAPNLSGFTKHSLSKSSEIPRTDELISDLMNYTKSAIPGVKTDLYRFQLRSLCKMLDRELFTRREPVPNFTTLTSPTGSTYYYDTLNPGFYSMPELYTAPRGGILAENMGLGKTLICLALICLTKHEVSSIPEDILLHTDQPTDPQLPGISSGTSVKSLREISREVIAQNSLPWKYYVDDLPPAVVGMLTKHPGSFRLSQESSRGFGLRTRERSVPTETYRTLYLCNTTLLIVPENLFHQWIFEIRKHIEPSHLKKLFVSERFKNPIQVDGSDYIDKVPQDPKVLSQYDFILLTIPAFTKARQKDSDDALMKVYWKRLIIDEGHSMTSKSSNLSVLCNSLQAERRWAITGTPTLGLTNLHMNEEEQTSQRVSDSPKKKRKYIVKSKFNAKDDLLKLGNLVASYFKIEPFHSQPKLWSNTIVRDLTSDNKLTAEQSLLGILNTLMIRHNNSQIEKDLDLPQLHHEAVFLEPSYQNKLAINLFTAVLAVNAVSSERVGGDYMFDPSNRQQLRRLVSNLQLATFYWTGFQISDIETLIKITKHCMSKKDGDNNEFYSQADRDLLVQSLKAAEEAFENPRWKTSAMLHEMQYFVTGLPTPFVKYYGTGATSGIGIFGAPQLAGLQEFFYKNRFMNMADEEALTEKMKGLSKPFWESYWNHNSRKENSKFKKQENSHDFDIHSLKMESEELSFQELAISPARRTSFSSQNWSDTKDNLTRADGGGLRVTEDADSLSVHDVKEARILGTASSKLSYLASRLVDHQATGVKSIVFFENEDSAYYLTELLDVLGVNYILYATFIGAGQRSNNLTDFDAHDAKSNGGMTLIMDLRLASHGLTIISATRVYFMNPVWQRSVEAQAIKRAHRIGQTQEVFVETLVLRGTLEEEIYKRREQNKPREETDGSRKYVIDDTGMQQFILKHEFLPTSGNEVEYSTFSAPVVEESQFENPPEDLDDEFSLKGHTATKSFAERQWHNNWTMRLFNKDNMQKLSVAKRQKANAEQLNIELVEGKAEVIIPERKSFTKRKRVTF